MDSKMDKRQYAIAACTEHVRIFHATSSAHGCVPSPGGQSLLSMKQRALPALHKRCGPSVLRPSMPEYNVSGFSGSASRFMTRMTIKIHKKFTLLHDTHA